MDNPKYVLTFNETAWMPKKYTKRMILLKIIGWVVLILCVIGYLACRETLFAEASLFTKITVSNLIFATVSWAWLSLFIESRVKEPNPMEIRFYDDYLVMYRKKAYYNPELSRMEFDKFMYKDIQKILYKPKADRLKVYGVLEGKWYSYNKDGSLSDKPFHCRVMNGLSYFYANETPDIDFVSVFEKYTPIKVIVE